MINEEKDKMKKKRKMKKLLEDALLTTSVLFCLLREVLLLHVQPSLLPSPLPAAATFGSTVSFSQFLGRWQQFLWCQPWWRKSHDYDDDGYD